MSGFLTDQELLQLAPTFCAVVITAPPPERSRDQGNVINLNDAAETSRIYRRIVCGER
jgi:hypothetical protein